MLTIKRILLFISLISPLWSIAKQKFSISGSIKDITSGEELIGAAVLVKEIPGTGVVANAYGFYSIELPTGEYTIRFQYTGYELKEQKIKLDKNLKLNVEMKPKSSELKEVEISAEKPDESLSRVNMGVEKLSAKEIKFQCFLVKPTYLKLYNFFLE
jgi:CarboxypepD_reg-like domain